MAFIRLSGFRATKEVLSSILNWVCPECGGRIGGALFVGYASVGWIAEWSPQCITR